MSLQEQLTQMAQERLPATLAWLRELVAVNSLTTHFKGVQEVGRITAEGFAKLGFVPEWIASSNPEHAHHLFLRRGPSHQNPILLVTHLDTVYSADEEAKNRFHWQEEGDRIYGPGTVDIKGGTALIHLMFEIMQKLMPDMLETHTWMIAANSAEEAISIDFSQRVHQHCPLGAKAVLVFEGGPKDQDGWHVVNARKGRVEYRLECEGRGAHAGSAWAQGINAVVELATLLPRIHAITDNPRSLTVNVANMQGGSVLNRVPHEAYAELEMRAFDPKVLASAAKLIEDMAGTTTGGAKINVKKLGETPAWPASENSNSLVTHWQQAGVPLGLKVVPRSRGGLSDANYLYDLGPTLDGLGPSGGNAHCSERSADGSKLPEYVEPSSFVTKAVLNLVALSTWLNQR
jgi:glutamate carboxypeptidase